MKKEAVEMEQIEEEQPQMRSSPKDENSPPLKPYPISAASQPLLLSGKRKRKPKELIDKVSPIFRRKKSSYPASKSKHASGRVTYNGHEMEEFVPQRTAAYISQHDLPELLEENSFHGRTADFFYMLLFGATVLTGIVIVGGMIPYVSESFAKIIFRSNSLTFMMLNYYYMK